MRPAIETNLRHSAVLLLLLMLSASASCRAPAATATQQWRFAIEEAEGSVQHAYALKFKSLIEARSEGRIEVVVYPYGTLGTSTQLTEQLSMGVLEFSMASPGSIGKFIPEAQVFLLHFLLPRDDHRLADQLADDNVHDLLGALYAEKNLHLVSIFSEGEMVWTADREIRTPDDFAGVKFRVMTTPLLLASYNAYGASATPMPYSEVYSALQLNMIDGQVNPVFAIERQKFYEVCDWLIFPGHAQFIATLAANREFFRQLPEPDRQLVEQAVDDTNQFVLDLQRRLHNERLKAILHESKRKRRVLNIAGDLTEFQATLTADEFVELIEENEFLNITSGLTDAERGAFRQLSDEVQNAYRDRVGRRGEQLLEAIRNVSAQRGE